MGSFLNHICMDDFLVSQYSVMVYLTKYVRVTWNNIKNK